MTEDSKIKKFDDYYDKKHQIGYGGAGIVYDCVSKTDKQHYAVKVCQAPDSRSLGLINSEIAICRMVDHKNIVIFIEAFKGTKVCHLVFEMMAGGDVFEDMARRKLYTEFDASGRLRQVFEGVAYLHENRIIHRDLKPENFLLSSKDDNAVVKIADFDSAMQYKGEKVNLLNFRVSLQYCSPDIIFGKGYWFPTDMWSCGVVLYLALFGELPFEGSDELSTVNKIMNGKYTFPGDCKPVSKEAEDLISGLLCVDQDTRYTARDVLNNKFIKYRDVIATTEHRAKAIENIKAFNLTKRKCRTESIRQPLSLQLYAIAQSRSQEAIDAIASYRAKSDESTLTSMAKRAASSADDPAHKDEASGRV